MSAQKKPAERIERAPLLDPPPPAFEVVQQDGRSLGPLPVAYIEGLITSGLLQEQDRLTVPHLGSIPLVDCDLVKRFFDDSEGSVEFEGSADPSDKDAAHWLSTAPVGTLPPEFSLDLDAPVTAGISMDLDELVAEARAAAPVPTNTPEPATAVQVATSPAESTNGEWSDYDPFAEEPAPEEPAPSVASAPANSGANGEWCDFDPLTDEALAHQGQEGLSAETGPQDDLSFLQTGLRHMSARAYTDAGTCFGQIEDPKLLDLAQAGSAFARFMQHSGRAAKQWELQTVEGILEIAGDVHAVHIIAGRMAALLGNKECARTHQAKGTHPQPDLPELRALAVAISVRGPSAPAMVAPRPSKASARALTVADQARGTHVAFIATLLGLFGLLMAAPTIQVSFSVDHRWLFGGQMLVMTIAAGFLTLGPGMKLKAPELLDPSASQVLTTLVAGLLIGAALPSVGLAGRFITAVAVRIALVLGIELLLRGSVDRWLEERLGGVLKPTLASGALFGLLYILMIAPRVESIGLAGGLATMAGLCLAGINFKYAAPRLATLAHIAAAITAAVIVG